MGVRKSTFSGGGGILNNSDATIKDIQFTFDPPYFANAKRFLHAVLTIQEDSRDGVTEQPFFVGGLEDDLEIRADGRAVTFNDPSRQFGRGTGFADLIESIDATDHPGTRTDSEDELDYSPLIGSRVRFVQQPLSAEELAKLKAKGGKTYRQDKKDPNKQWPLTKTVVSKFYGIEAVAVKAAGKAAKTVTVDAKGVAADVVLEVLSETPISIAKLKNLVLKAMMKHPQKALQAEVTALVQKPSFLGGLDGVVFDEDAMEISAAA
jgi:hypothetical protein